MPIMPAKDHRQMLATPVFAAANVVVWTFNLLTAAAWLA